MTIRREGGREGERERKSWVGTGGERERLVVVVVVVVVVSDRNLA